VSLRRYQHLARDDRRQDHAHRRRGQPASGPTTDASRPSWRIDGQFGRPTGPERRRLTETVGFGETTPAGLAQRFVVEVDGVVLQQQVADDEVLDGMVGKAAPRGQAGAIAVLDGDVPQHHLLGLGDGDAIAETAVRVGERVVHERVEDEVVCADGVIDFVIFI
jgi:hypothetical protein